VDEHLRFGTYLAPNILPVYEAVTDEVGRRLGIETELVVETSYESCEKDENEVCFVCSLPYVTFERRGLDVAVPVAAPVLEGERYGGVRFISPTSSSTRTAPSGPSLICAADPGPTTSGCRTPGTESRATTSCSWGRPTAPRRSRGGRVPPGGHPPGGPEGSGRLGDRFASTRRGAPRPSGSCERHPGGGGAGPSTIQPVAVSRRVPKDLREAIRDVLVTLAAVRERLALGLVERFEAVDAESFDDIRMMVDACEAAGFLELR